MPAHSRQHLDWTECSQRLSSPNPEETIQGIYLISTFLCVESLPRLSSAVVMLQHVREVTHIPLPIATQVAWITQQSGSKIHNPTILDALASCILLN